MALGKIVECSVENGVFNMDFSHDVWRAAASLFGLLNWDWIHAKYRGDPTSNEGSGNHLHASIVDRYQCQ